MYREAVCICEDAQAGRSHGMADEPVAWTVGVAWLMPALRVLRGVKSGERPWTGLMLVR